MPSVDALKIRNIMFVALRQDGRSNAYNKEELLNHLLKGTLQKNRLKTQPELQNSTSLPRGICRNATCDHAKTTEGTYIHTIHEVENLKQILN